LADNEFIMK